MQSKLYTSMHIAIAHTMSIYYNVIINLNNINTVTKGLSLAKGLVSQSVLVQLTSNELKQSISLLLGCILCN